MSTKKKRASQYDHVKSILTNLQGNNIPSYQGLGAFWMDHALFTTASLYGQRLIAPAGGSSGGGSSSGCCGPSSATGRPPAAEKKGCCGGGSESGGGDTASMPDQNPETNPAVAAVQEPPTETFIGDCWPSGGPGGGGGGGGSATWRSDQSAIIIGLKGLYPFDGSIFPPLLWDTDNKPTPKHIQTIATWIDSGCHIDEGDEDKVKVKMVARQNTKMALANGEVMHTVSTNKGNTDQKKNKDLTIRREIGSLSEPELKTYREALACMYTYNDFWQDERSFDFWARIHTNSCQHGWEQFTTWHRMYLYFFEQKLQDYDEDIALPYWDWTEYTKENRKAFNNTELDLGSLPDRFGCFLTSTGLDKLKDAKDVDGGQLFSTTQISALTSIQKKGTVYQSGLRFLTAAKIDYNIVKQDNAAAWGPKVRAVYNVLRADNPLWFPNRWPGSVGNPLLYPESKDIDNILNLTNWSDFGGGPSYDHHYGSLEKIHNGMHLFSGGVNPCFPTKTNTKWLKHYTDNDIPIDPQSKENPPAGWMTDNRTTAFDPIFWSHHANVDRIWAEWQKKHNGQPEQLNGVLAPWSTAVDDSLSTKKLGYKYARHYVHYKVASDVGVVKFNSEGSKPSVAALDRHKKLEIKLHRVQRGNLPNATVRVFLNQPDVSMSTPTGGNAHFVEEICLFHGSCYGGPGHCNLPLDKTRPFDHRSIHHHEPRNYLIDATKTAQGLLNDGAKDLSVQLVVVGLDGKRIDNALFIDGVSMCYLD